MNTNDNAERRLRSWLADEGQVGDTTHLFEAVANGSRGMRQRPGLVVRLRSGGMGSGNCGVLGAATTRRVGSLVLIVLLIALLAAGALLVGSQLLTPSPTSLLVPADRGVFTPVGPMAVARQDPTATLLRDGRVLVIGGCPDIAGAVAPVELWDPATGIFSPMGKLARCGQTATLLGDGRVLIVGGVDANDRVAPTQIWDPATGAFSPSGMPTIARSGGTSQLLPDGRVLVSGGYDYVNGDGNVLTSAEVWDPHTGLFSPGDSVPEASYPGGTLLADGRILVVGGTGGVDVKGNAISAQVWDPVTGSSSPAGALTEVRGHGFSATRLRDGRVLVIGGGVSRMVMCWRGTPSPDGSCHGSGGGAGTTQGLKTAEIWDPATTSFNPTGSLSQAHYSHAATLLLDGRVLILGDDVGAVGADGHSGSSGNSAEVFELK